MIRDFAIFIVGLFFKLFYRHKTYGTENIPDGAAIVAANHSSFYDPPIVGVSCTDYVHFLAKESLFRFPPFGWLLKQLATHPVAKGKGNTETFKKAYAFLQNGEKVMIFPEGGRNHDGVIGRGLLGTGVLVMRSKAVVIPVYIHGSYEAWNVKRKFPKLWGKTACVFGKPLDFSRFADFPDRKEGQRLIVEQIMEAIKGLRKWYLTGHKGSPP